MAGRQQCGIQASPPQPYLLLEEINKTKINAVFQLMTNAIKKNKAMRDYKVFPEVRVVVLLLMGHVTIRVQQVRDN